MDTITLKAISLGRQENNDKSRLFGSRKLGKVPTLSDLLIRESEVREKYFSQQFSKILEAELLDATKITSILKDAELVES